MLLQVLQNYNTTQVQNSACSSFELILQNASLFPELSREFSTSVVPSLIPLLLGANQEWEVAALRCLNTVMQNFPGPCGNFKNKIERLVISRLLSVRREHDLCPVLCQCLASLARCGGGGSTGAKWTEAWSFYVRGVIRGLHDTLDLLYRDLETRDTENQAIIESLMTIEVTTEQEPNRTLSLINTYKVLCDVLGTILTQETQMPVPIPVEAILDTVCRALAISPKFLMSRPTRERILLCSVLPSVHQVSLQVFQHLIMCTQNCLLPHCVTINRLFSQCLDHYGDMTESRDAHEQPFSDLRCMLYDVASAWFVTGGVITSSDSLVSSLLSHALSDAQPRVSSSMSSSSAPNAKLEEASQLWGKKKRKKNSSGGGKAQQKLSWQQKSDQQKNSRLCVASLSALRQLVLKCGTFLKSEHHKKLQEFCVPLLLDLQQGHKVIVSPYGSSVCRSALYRLLLALVLVPNPRWPPSTHLAVKIFSLGQTKEHELAVKAVCQDALTVCGTVIHPRLPPLMSPVTLDKVTVIDKPAQKNAVPPTATIPRGGLPKKRKRSEERQPKTQAERAVEEAMDAETINSDDDDEELESSDENDDGDNEIVELSSDNSDVIMTGEDIMDESSESEESSYDEEGNTGQGVQGARYTEWGSETVNSGGEDNETIEIVEIDESVIIGDNAMSDKPNTAAGNSEGENVSGALSMAPESNSGEDFVDMTDLDSSPVRPSDKVIQTTADITVRDKSQSDNSDSTTATSVPQQISVFGDADCNKTISNHDNPQKQMTNDSSGNANDKANDAEKSVSENGLEAEDNTGEPTANGKRKLQDVDETDEPFSKKTVDPADLMLQSFVDTGPDQD